MECDHPIILTLARNLGCVCSFFGKPIKCDSEDSLEAICAMHKLLKMPPNITGKAQILFRWVNKRMFTSLVVFEAKCINAWRLHGTSALSHAGHGPCYFKSLSPGTIIHRSTVTELDKAQRSGRPSLYIVTNMWDCVCVWLWVQELYSLCASVYIRLRCVSARVVHAYVSVHTLQTVLSDGRKTSSFSSTLLLLLLLLLLLFYSLVIGNQ